MQRQEEENTLTEVQEESKQEHYQQEDPEDKVPNLDNSLPQGQSLCRGMLLPKNAKGPTRIQNEQIAKTTHLHMTDKKLSNVRGDTNEPPVLMNFVPNLIAIYLNDNLFQMLHQESLYGL
jgi:hypothetical protein